MATIVRLVGDSRRYLLIGVGYGTSESAKPHWFMGDLGYERRSTDQSLVCLCDSAGKLYWADSDEITVESIDGIPPDAALTDPADT